MHNFFISVPVQNSYRNKVYILQKSTSILIIQSVHSVSAKHIATTPWQHSLASVDWCAIKIMLPGERSPFYEFRGTFPVPYSLPCSLPSFPIPWILDSPALQMGERGLKIPISSVT